MRTVGRAGLALAVVTVVVASDDGSVDVSREGDGFAEAVARDGHDGRLFGLVDWLVGKVTVVAESQTKEWEARESYMCAS